MADEIVVDQPQVNQPMIVTQSTFNTPLPVMEAPVVDNPAPDTSNASVSTDGTIIDTPAPTTDVPEIQENEAAVFTMPTFGEPAPQAQAPEATTNNQPQAAQTDWKEVIKNVDRKELLKAAGLDDFDIEFAEYRKTGNDPAKYLEAKAFNYDTISDTDMIKRSLSEKFPTYTADELDRYINRKYGLNSTDEDEMADGLLMLKADAYEARTAKKQEQAKFVIPTIEKPQEVVNQQNQLQQQQAEQQRQQQIQAFQTMVNEHEATKKLIESKRVTIDLGEGIKPFNFPIDNPDSLLSIAFGDNWARAIAVNPQEVDRTKLIPDIAKLQKIAYIASNPNYEKDIFNYGKSQGLKAIIEDGQNAKRPDGTTPMPVKQTAKEASQNVTQSTYGAPIHN